MSHVGRTPFIPQVFCTENQVSHSLSVSLTNSTPPPLNQNQNWNAKPQTVCLRFLQNWDDMRWHSFRSTSCASRLIIITPFNRWSWSSGHRKKRQLKRSWLISLNPPPCFGAKWIMVVVVYFCYTIHFTRFTENKTRARHAKQTWLSRTRAFPLSPIETFPPHHSAPFLFPFCICC